MQNTLIKNILKTLHENRNKFIIFFVCLLVISTTIYILIATSPFKIVMTASAANSKKENLIKKKKETIFKVISEKAKTKNIPIFLESIGTVLPIESAVVKTQLSGELKSVQFKEGQLVKNGDLLAEIDSKTYQAQLMQYEGQLLKDKALLNNARLDLKRYKMLIDTGGISKQTLDTQNWLVKQYEGAVKSDKGLLEVAKINLDRCKIKAPISGLAGLRKVNPGNYVQVSDPNGIVIINKLQPISVIFSLPSDHIQKIINKFKTKSKITVSALDKQKEHILDSGDLVSSENQIDSTTGTIKLKAIFKNENLILFPNQFVNIKVLIDFFEDAIVIPTSAIQRDKKGDFVYLIKNNKVKINYISTSIEHENETIGVSGIKKNDSVVSEGTNGLFDGAEVAL